MPLISESWVTQCCALQNFGEDPFHVAKMGVGATLGLQGRNCGGANVTLGKTKISAQAKHYAVYGAGGRDGYTPMGGGPSERTVFEVYLRPWLKFAQAGGRGVMLSHNMVSRKKDAPSLLWCRPVQPAVLSLLHRSESSTP